MSREQLTLLVLGKIGLALPKSRFARSDVRAGSAREVRLCIVSVQSPAMACDTPVIAFNRGSVPEIIEDGLTGFVVEGAEEAVAATEGLSRLSRGAIRQRFEQRFTARRMAREYLAVYRSLIEFEALRDRAGTSYRLVPRDSRPHLQSKPQRIPSSHLQSTSLLAG